MWQVTYEFLDFCLGPSALLIGLSVLAPFPSFFTEHVVGNPVSRPHLRT